MSHARSSYKPQDTGWIGISDPWNKTLGYIDCRNGGAQQVFTDLCRAFERAGWELQARKFDWQYVRKGNIRWEIRIGVLPPGAIHRHDQDEPRYLSAQDSSGPVKL
jgi:hypothetical protein